MSDSAAELSGTAALRCVAWCVCVVGLIFIAQTLVAKLPVCCWIQLNRRQKRSWQWALSNQLQTHAFPVNLPVWCCSYVMKIAESLRKLNSQWIINAILLFPNHFSEKCGRIIYNWAASQSNRRGTVIGNVTHGRASDVNDCLKTMPYYVVSSFHYKTCV